MDIHFGVWAPDQETFWNSWIVAGICSAPYEFTSEYPGIEVTSSWPGIIDGVDGWHANVKVTEPLVSEMTYGLNQHDANDNLLSIWDRTWAAQIFNLTETDIDPVTGFPTGYRNNTSGVKYCDPSEFKSPSNVWA